MAEFISRRYHIIIDAHNCSKDLLTDKSLVESMIKKIASICDMKILHGPIVIEGVPENPGITGFAIIDFSHISIHTFSDSGELCIDVFSCKNFDYNTVETYVKKSFNLDDNSTKIINVKHGSL